MIGPMAAPHQVPVFGSDVYVAKLPGGAVSLSGKLAALLVEARNMYAWPIGETAAVSQQRIIDLETETRHRVKDLDVEKAHWIVSQVSMWAGNNARAQCRIDTALSPQKAEFQASVQKLSTSGSVKEALQALSEQPGLGLVIATKVFRFCSPEAGAALDRHCSYFFNSLPVRGAAGGIATGTRFKREWANGRRHTTRLAIYYHSGYQYNLDEYVATYLPLLAAIAEWLDRQGIRYVCAASSKKKHWRPADIEMAAYYWWSRHG